MGEVPEGWEEMVASFEPHVSPEWARHAREHADKSWVRLIVMVDAHAQLNKPGIAEKIAMTMTDLAMNRPQEQEGWMAIRSTAEDRRVELVSGLVDSAEKLLPEELWPFFVRSVDPVTSGPTM
jgi:hypothetical protein